jgi:hypothetical protein
MWLIGLYFLKIFPSIFKFFMSPFDSPLQNWFLLMQWVFTLKVLNQKLNLKFYQIYFWFEFLVYCIWMKKEQVVMITVVLNGKT